MTDIPEKGVAWVWVRIWNVVDKLGVSRRRTATAN